MHFLESLKLLVRLAPLFRYIVAASKIVAVKPKIGIFKTYDSGL